MEELRSWWEVPSIAHFCSLFRTAFNLTDFDIEDLEEAILLDCTQEESSQFLVDLLCRLLMGCYSRDDICSFNYDLYVKDVIKYKWGSEPENPINQKSSFKELTMREKVELLHSVCDYRLDAEDVMDLLKGLDGDNMRVEPLGKDHDGALYWYFYGSRLYKEDPDPEEKKEKKDKKKKVKEKKKDVKQKKKQTTKQEKKRGKSKRKSKQKPVKVEKKSEPESSNIRRSGRLRQKQEREVIESESSSEDEDTEYEEEEEESSETEEELSEDEVPLVKIAKSKAKSQQQTPIQKRGRGRPRKTVVKTKEVEEKEDAEEETEKKEDEKQEKKADTSRRRGRRSRRTLETEILEKEEEIETVEKTENEETKLNETEKEGKYDNPSDIKCAEKNPGETNVNELVSEVKNEDDEVKSEGVEIKEEEMEAKTDTDLKEADDKLHTDIEMEEQGKVNVKEDIKNNSPEMAKEEKDSMTVVEKNNSEDRNVGCEEEMETEIDSEVVNKNEFEQKKPELDNDIHKNADTRLDKEMNESDNEDEDVVMPDEIEKGEVDEQKDVDKQPSEDGDKDCEKDKMKMEDSDSVKAEAVEKSEEEPMEKTPPPRNPASLSSPFRWNLICSTLDDWVNLVEWFKGTSYRCEKELIKVIKEDFLPVLPEIIETREAEKRRRLQEQEVRRSARITYKQREKEEQERILAEAMAEEEKAKQQAEEERRIILEQQRLEEENKKREERIRAREERARRLEMREERARLMAEGKEIPPELLYTAPPTHKYKDDWESDSSRSDILDDYIYESLMKIVDAMKNHMCAWPFLQPVTEDQAPGYLEAIRRPMDLSKIEKKVELKEYKTQSQFESDFRLMFNNCKRFNGPESDFTSKARVMEKAFYKNLRKFLLDESTDSYYVDDDYTVKTRVSEEKKYRPKRAASSRALQTVHKALNESDESSDEDAYITPLRKPVVRPKPPVSSSTSLLLQEIVELKRQRAVRKAEGALDNDEVVVRPRPGPPQTQGVMIMPKEEVPTKGVLRLAATREIKWKINPDARFNGMKTSPSLKKIENLTPLHRQGVYEQQKIKLVQGGSPASGTTSTPPGSNRVIKIMAPKGTPGAKAALASAVKVSEDGYLIINGKNSGVKVTGNAKIVIQAPPSPASVSKSPMPGTQTQSENTKTNEPILDKIPTPVLDPNFMRQSASSYAPVTVQTNRRTPAIINATPRTPTASRSSGSVHVLKRPQSLNSSESSNSVRMEDAIQTILQETRAQIASKRKHGEETEYVPGIKVRRPSQNEEHKSYQPLKLNSQRAAPDSGDNITSVVSSVNIAQDILDSYYSVMNNSSSADSVSLECEQTPVLSSDSRETTPCEDSNSNNSEIPATSAIDTVMQNTDNTENMKSLSNIVNPDELLTQQSVNSLHTTNSVAAKSSPDHLHVNNASSKTSYETESNNAVTLNSVQDPSHNSQYLNNSNSTSEMGPIEALFRGDSLPIKMVSPTRHIANNPLVSVTSPHRAEEVSPGKSTSRPSLFDVFAQASDHSTDKNVTEDLGLTLLSRTSPPKSQSSLNNGKVTVGSPLKTTEVMEALKSKLMNSSPVKPALQPTTDQDEYLNNLPVSMVTAAGFGQVPNALSLNETNILSGLQQTIQTASPPRVEIPIMHQPLMSGATVTMETSCLHASFPVTQTTGTLHQPNLDTDQQ